VEQCFRANICEVKDTEEGDLTRPYRITVLISDKSNKVAKIAMYEDGNAVIEDLRDPVEVSKQALQAKVAEAAELDKWNYTKESWSAVEGALTDAQAVLDNEEATQAEVDNALVALEAAIEGLAARAILKAPDGPKELAIPSLTTENVLYLAFGLTNEAGSQVASSLTEVKEFIDEEYGVNFNADAIKVIDGKLSITGSILSQEDWRKVKDTEEGDLTRPYRITVLISDKSNKVAKIAMYEDGNAVIEDLRDPVEVSKQALQAKVAEAAELDKWNYTKESWSAVEGALTDAQAVLDNEEATQAEVDNALVALEAAIEGLAARAILKAPDGPKELAIPSLTTENVLYLAFGLTNEAGSQVASSLTEVKEFIDEEYGVNFNADAIKVIDGKLSITGSILSQEDWRKVKDTEEGDLTRPYRITVLISDKSNKVAKIAMYEDGNAVIEDLRDPVEVSKQALQAKVAEAAELDKWNYTKESWSAVEGALTDAQAVLDNEEATQAEVDNALVALEAAIEGLAARAILKAPDGPKELAIPSLTTENVLYLAFGLTNEAGSQVASSLTEVKEFIDEEYGVNFNADAIKVIDGKLSITGSILSQEDWRKVKDTEEGDLTRPYRITVLISDKSNKVAKIAMYEDGNAVIEDLRDPVEVSKQALQAKVAEAAELDKWNYTKESWSAVEGALTDAQAVLDNEEATQAEVDNALVALEAAIEGLAARAILKAPDGPKELAIPSLTTENVLYLAFGLTNEAGSQVASSLTEVKEFIDEEYGVNFNADAIKVIDGKLSITGSILSQEDWRKVKDTEEGDLTRPYRITVLISDKSNKVAKIAMYEDGNAVIEDLRDPVEVSKQALQAKVAEAAELDKWNYTKESWSAVEGALTDAQAVLDNEEATQAEVDNALVALEAAIEGLAARAILKAPDGPKELAIPSLTTENVLYLAFGLTNEAGSQVASSLTEVKEFIDEEYGVNFNADAIKVIDGKLSITGSILSQEDWRKVKDTEEGDLTRPYRITVLISDKSNKVAKIAMYEDGNAVIEDLRDPVEVSKQALQAKVAEAAELDKWNYTKESWSAVEGALTDAQAVLDNEEATQAEVDNALVALEAAIEGLAARAILKAPDGPKELAIPSLTTENVLYLAFGLTNEAGSQVASSLTEVKEFIDEEYGVNFNADAIKVIDGKLSITGSILSQEDWRKVKDTEEGDLTRPYRITVLISDKSNKVAKIAMYEDGNAVIEDLRDPVEVSKQALQAKVAEAAELDKWNYTKESWSAVEGALTDAQAVLDNEEATQAEVDNALVALEAAIEGLAARAILKAPDGPKELAIPSLTTENVLYLAFGLTNEAGSQVASSLTEVKEFIDEEYGVNFNADAIKVIDGKLSITGSILSQEDWRKVKDTEEGDLTRPYRITVLISDKSNKVAKIAMYEDGNAVIEDLRDPVEVSKQALQAKVAEAAELDKWNYTKESWSAVEGALTDAQAVLDNEEATQAEVDNALVALEAAIEGLAARAILKAPDGPKELAIPSLTTENVLYLAFGLTNEAGSQVASSLTEVKEFIDEEYGVNFNADAIKVIDGKLSITGSILSQEDWRKVKDTEEGDLTRPYRITVLISDKSNKVAKIAMYEDGNAVIEDLRDPVEVSKQALQAKVAEAAELDKWNYTKESWSAVEGALTDAQAVLDNEEATQAEVDNALVALEAAIEGLAARAILKAPDGPKELAIPSLTTENVLYLAFGLTNEAGSQVASSLTEVKEFIDEEYGVNFNADAIKVIDGKLSITGSILSQEDWRKVKDTEEGDLTRPYRITVLISDKSNKVAKIAMYEDGNAVIEDLRDPVEVSKQALQAKVAEAAELDKWNYTKESWSAVEGALTDAQAVLDNEEATQAEVDNALVALEAAIEGLAARAILKAPDGPKELAIPSLTTENVLYLAFGLTNEAGSQVASSLTEVKEFIDEEYGVNFNADAIKVIDGKLSITGSILSQEDWRKVKDTEEGDLTRPYRITVLISDKSNKVAKIAMYEDGNAVIEDLRDPVEVSKQALQAKVAEAAELDKWNYTKESWSAVEGALTDAQAVLDNEEATQAEVDNALVALEAAIEGLAARAILKAPDGPKELAIPSLTTENVLYLAFGLTNEAGSQVASSLTEVKEFIDEEYGVNFNADAIKVIDGKLSITGSILSQEDWRKVKDTEEGDLTRPYRITVLISDKSNKVAKIAMYEDGNAVIEDLRDPVEVSKQALQAKVAEAAELDKWNYTKESWSAVEGALTDAQAVLDNEEATQAEVDNALVALEAAIEGLAARAILKAPDGPKELAIPSLTTENVLYLAFGLTNEAGSQVASSLTEVKEFIDEEYGVNFNADAIKVIDGKLSITGSILSQEDWRKVKDTEEGDLTRPYRITVLISDKSNKVAKIAMYEDGNAVIEDLRDPVEVSKQALQAKVAEAAELDKWNYTKESWSAVEGALTDAQAVLDNEEATQAEVDNALVALEAAIEGLAARAILKAPDGPKELAIPSLTTENVLYLAFGLTNEAGSQVASSLTEVKEFIDEEYGVNFNADAIKVIDGKLSITGSILSQEDWRKVKDTEEGDLTRPYRITVLISDKSNKVAKIAMYEDGNAVIEDLRDPVEVSKQALQAKVAEAAELDKWNYTKESWSAVEGALTDAQAVLDNEEATQAEVDNALVALEAAIEGLAARAILKAPDGPKELAIPSLTTENVLYLAFGLTNEAGSQVASSLTEVKEFIDEEYGVNFNADAIKVIDGKLSITGSILSQEDWRKVKDTEEGDLTRPYRITVLISDKSNKVAKIAMYEDGNAVIEDLRDPVEVSKQALQAKVAEAAELDKWNYTKESWSAVEGALTDAQAVLDNEEATQAEVDNALVALEAAIEGLAARAILKAPDGPKELAIPSLTTENVLYLAFGLTNEAGSQVASSLTEVKEFIDEEYGVNFNADAIKVIDGKLSITGSILSQEDWRKVKDTEEGDLTRPYRITVLISDKSNKVAKIAMYEDGNAVIEDLRDPVEVSKQALQAKVAEAAELDKWNYTKESWSAVEGALTDAQAVLDNEEATQAEVDNALVALEAAIEGLAARAILKAPDGPKELAIPSLTTENVLYLAFGLTNEAGSQVASSLTEVKEFIDEEYGVNFNADAIKVIDGKLSITGSILSQEDWRKVKDTEEGDLTRPYRITVLISDKSNKVAKIAMYEDGNAVIEDLRDPVEVSKQALQAKVAEAAELDKWNYTKESWSAVEGALTDAQAVLDNEEATQAEVDNALVALEAAIEGLAARAILKAPDGPKELAIPSLTTENVLYLAFGLTNEAGSQVASSLTEVKEFIDEEYGVNFNADAIKVIDGKLSITGSILSQEDWRKVKDTEEGDLTRPYRITVLISDKSNKVAKIAMYEDGNAVIEDLRDPVEVSKQALQAKVAEAAELDKWNYTKESWSAVEGALTDAQAVLDNEEATQAEVDNALVALEAAIEGLAARAILKAPDGPKELAIPSLTTENVLYLAFGLTNEAGSQVASSLTEVKEFIDEEYGVNFNADAIKVIDGKLSITGSILSQEDWRKVKDTEEGDLTRPYRITVLISDKSNKVAKIAMYEDGNAVIEDLRDPVEVSKQALQAKVAEAAELDKWNYTKESWSAVEGALTDAQAVLDNEEATQAEVDNALVALEAAIEGLAARAILKAPDGPKELAIPSLTTENVLYLAFGLTNEAGSQVASSLTEVKEFIDEEYGVNFNADAIKVIDGKLSITGSILSQEDWRKVKDTEEGDLTRPYRITVLISDKSNKVAKIAMYEDGNAVIEDLRDPVEVSKQALQAKVAEAAELDKWNYTKESWSAVEGALTDAQAVLDNEEATQAEVDNALVALEAAIEGLAARAILKAPDGPKELAIPSLTTENVLYLAFGLTNEAGSQVASSLTEVKEFIDEEYGVNFNADAIKVIDGKLSITGSILSQEDWRKVKDTEEGDLTRPYRITVLISDKSNKVAKIAMYEDGNAVIEDLRDPVEVSKQALQAKVAEAAELDKWNYTKESWSAV
jgi:hypothetical protein